MVKFGKYFGHVYHREMLNDEFKKMHPLWEYNRLKIKRLYPDN